MHVRGLDLFFYFLLIVLLCFPPVGGTLCEVFTYTRSDVWLINSDLVRFIPMMIARIIISLKKVASSRQPYLDLGIPSGLSMRLQDSHITADNIQLSEL